MVAGLHCRTEYMLRAICVLTMQMRSRRERTEMSDPTRRRSWETYNGPAPHFAASSPPRIGAVAIGVLPHCPAGTIDDGGGNWPFGRHRRRLFIVWAQLRTGPWHSEPILTWLPNGTPLRIRGLPGTGSRSRAGGVSGWVDSWSVLLRGTESTVIDRGNPAVKRVALTFDCGSDYGYAGQILSRLAFHGIPASFGLTGAWMTANPDAALRIAVGGYQMINHTLNHPSYTGASTPGTGPASPAKRLSQIQANENMIKRLPAECQAILAAAIRRYRCRSSAGRRRARLLENRDVDDRFARLERPDARTKSTHASWRTWSRARSS